MKDDVARALIDALYAATPVPSGCRVNHARGILVEGRFRPSPAAAQLSSATVFSAGDAPALLRFSSSTGDQRIAQNDPRADPRGLAVQIGDPAALVLVGHSVDRFPAADGSEFLEFLKTVAAGSVNAGSAEQHLAENEAGHSISPSLSQPIPGSFTTQIYHMLHPYRFTSDGEAETIGRLTVGPVGGVDQQSYAHNADHLDRDLRLRLGAGDVEMALRLHLAPEGVDLSDISEPWLDAQAPVELGHFVLERVAYDQASQSHIVFDPGVVPSGIAFAGDAMIETRLAAYRIAFERRIPGESQVDGVGVRGGLALSAGR